MSSAPVTTAEPFLVFKALRTTLLQALSILGIPDSVQALGALESQGRFGTAKAFIQESFDNHTPLLNTFIRFDSSLTPNLTFTMPPRKVKSIHSTYIKMDNGKSGSRVDLQGRVVFADSSLMVVVDTKKGHLFAFTRQSATSQTPTQPTSTMTQEQILSSASALVGIDSSIFSVPSEPVSGAHWFEKWRESFSFPNPHERYHALMSVYVPSHKGIVAVLSTDIYQSEVARALAQEYMTPAGASANADRFFPSYAHAFSVKNDSNLALFAFKSGDTVVGASVVKIVDHNSYLKERRQLHDLKTSTHPRK